MDYVSEYQSPMGTIILASDGANLTGLWFEGQKYFGDTLKGTVKKAELPVFDMAKSWLDIYFGGKNPEFQVPVSLNGSPSRQEVWDILRQIPYGKVMTYGEIGKIVAGKRGLASMSAQAVGGAVGHNPISVIVPCHRVIGSNGSLTGYAGGVDKKKELLALEGVDLKKLYLQRKNS